MHVSEFLSRLDGVRAAGGGHVARCPGHGDDRASLSISEGDDGRVLVNCHAGCSSETVVAALGLTMKDLFPAKEKPVRQAKPAPPPLSAEDVAAMAKALREDADAWRHVTEVLKFSPAVMEQLQLGLHLVGGRRWLAYPYRRGGSFTFANCRALDGQKDFIRRPAGQKTHVYNIDSLQDGGTAIVLEGERDAAAALTLGLDADAVVAVPGVNQVKAAVEALAKQKTIFVATDADAAGDEAAEELAAKLGRERCRRVRFAGFKDLGDVLSEKGVDEARRVAREAIATAQASPSPSSPPSTRAAAGRRKGKDLASAPDDVEPAAEPQDTGTLLKEVRGAFERHVVLPSGASTVLALWSLHTWTLDAARYTPRIVLRSPTKRCGKTLTLQLMRLFSRRPLLAANVSAAVLFRAIDAWQPTLLVDEADSFLDGNEELRGIINAGFEAHGAVLRCHGDEHEPRSFKCYSAVAIASIDAVPGTISDRAITIELARKTKEDRVTRLDRRARDHLAAVRPRLSRWAEDALPVLTESIPEVPRSLNDRQVDISEPLFAIADMGGGEWPGAAREAVVGLCQAGDSDDLKERLLRDVWALFEDETEFLSLQSICERLVENETGGWGTVVRGKPLTTDKVARWFRGFGLVSVQSRKDTDRRRGYRREDIAGVAARYLDALSSSPEGVTPVTGVTTRINTGVPASRGLEFKGVTQSADGVTPHEPPHPPEPRHAHARRDGPEGVTLSGPPNGRCHAVTPVTPVLERAVEGVDVPVLTAEQLWGTEGVAAARRQAEAQERAERGQANIAAACAILGAEVVEVRSLAAQPDDAQVSPDTYLPHLGEPIMLWELAERLGRDVGSVERDLHALRRRGLVRHLEHGHPPTRHWGRT